MRLVLLQAWLMAWLVFGKKIRKLWALSQTQLGDSSCCLLSSGHRAHTKLKRCRTFISLFLHQHLLRQLVTNAVAKQKWFDQTLFVEGKWSGHLRVKESQQQSLSNHWIHFWPIDLSSRQLKCTLMVIGDPEGTVLILFAHFVCSNQLYVN